MALSVMEVTVKFGQLYEQPARAVISVVAVAPLVAI